MMLYVDSIPHVSRKIDKKIPKYRKGTEMYPRYSISLILRSSILRIPFDLKL